MYATFDRSSPTQLDADVLCLSWKGEARQGWLASGNSRKTVGITYTQLRGDDECDCDPFYEIHENSLERQSMRRNFNFREHSHEVTIVRWNKHLDKIATCDSSGTVIVWRNSSGRSIMELVNNRGTPISDFQWSNDGNRVLIAYVDGYVLMGTAFGRRIWARQLSLGSYVTSPINSTQSSRLLSSTWSPDNSRIVVGSSIGELIELDAIHGGTLVSTTEVLPGIGIIGLQWVYGPKTPIASSPPTSSDNNNGSSEEGGSESNKQLSSSSNVRLSLYLRNGKVVLMNSCGDQQATIIRTGLIEGKMLWSSDGSILTIAGFRKSQSQATVRFFQPTGQLLFTLPLETKEPVTAVSWAHSDQKLFVATKNLLHSINIHRGVPSLQSLCLASTAAMIPGRENSFDLPLPTRLKVAVAENFEPVIQGHVPQPGKLLEYVSKSPPLTHRIYCTVIPNDHITSSSSSSSSNGAQPQRSRHSSSYTLYVEHLGTLVPILEAQKRSTKIRQSFTISLPTGSALSLSNPQPHRTVPDTTDTEVAMEMGDAPSNTTPPGQIRGSQLFTHEAHNSINTESGFQLACREDDGGENTRLMTAPPDLAPQQQRPSVSSLDNSRQLVEVTSNVMASKFRIQSLCDKLPSDMASITIKTSFLHIQPRKVIVLLPQVGGGASDSGIDTDTSDEDSVEDLASSSVECLINESDSYSIENIMSMEELQLPRSIELESQTLRPVESHTLKPYPPRGQRVSSDAHIQIFSKTPTWNEQHMIYQLDFGGRVTTKSAKNFQLELDNEQVLQFGRIDHGAFILDFQAPFSPIQAFATALANLV